MKDIIQSICMFKDNKNAVVTFRIGYLKKLNWDNPKRKSFFKFTVNYGRAFAHCNPKNGYYSPAQIENVCMTTDEKNMLLADRYNMILFSLSLRQEIKRFVTIFPLIRGLELFDNGKKAVLIDSKKDLIVIDLINQKELKRFSDCTKGSFVDTFKVIY